MSFPILRKIEGDGSVEESYPIQESPVSICNNYMKRQVVHPHHNMASAWFSNGLILSTLFQMPAKSIF